MRRCASCGAPLEHLFVDLGMSPPSEDFLTADRLVEPQLFYPLDVRICETCLLVQLPAYVAPAAIFTEYAYFSSYSDTWVEHARTFVNTAVDRLALGPGSRVVEIASNDGYLLRHVLARGVPALGVEPARNIASVAMQHGVPTIVEFFGSALAERIVTEHGPADLVVANNVFAHIPDLNDFTAGLARLLAPGGTLTIEVQHLPRLIESSQFDTIYHEHYLYWTLLAARTALARHHLRLLDVEALTTHGGSIRMWIVRTDDSRPTEPSVARMIEQETGAGYDRLDGYAGFADRVASVKRDLLEFLIAERRAGRHVVGYGAPGKGNTLLNYCGIRTDLVDYLVDRNPYKHGRYAPGTRIPILAPEEIDRSRPDVILILPWNLRSEIVPQLERTRAWGARLVIPIPRLEVIPA